jgi:tetratricopeptide (TPR) repeat protein
MRAKRIAWLRQLAVAAALWLTAAAAQAQILDRVDVNVVGDDAVVRIEFNVLTQYLRHVPTSHGSAVRVYFQITGANDQGLGVVEEERRAQPSNLLPQIRVIYPAQLPSVQRYIDVVFESAVDFRVQPEGNNRILVYVRLSPEQLERLRGPKPAPVAPPAVSPPSAAPSTTVPPAAAPPTAAPVTVAPPAVTPPAAAAPTVSPPAVTAPPATAPISVPPPPAPSAPVIVTPSSRGLPLPPATVLIAPASDVDKQAAADIADGRGALATGDNGKAALAFRRALDLPANAYAQEAQELVGIAHERNGEYANALSEYQEYLKLYPDGPGALRVRDRINGLPARPARSAAALRSLPLPPPTVATAPATEIDKQAATDLADGRAALTAGNNEQAVVALNRALNLPPNAYSQEAQELIGIARERNGETEKAQAEFQLYLKLYPDSPGAARVREHLNALAAPVVPMGGSMALEAPAAQPALSYWGSISQYYYGGQSETTNTRTITTPATNATTLDTSKISATDQSQLVNNVDLTARYRDGDWDSRFVVRDQYVANFLTNGSNKNWLNALYAETRYLPGQLLARIGRQSATSGGVLGLFDGAIGSWGFLPNYRLNAVVGQPVDNPFNTTSTFYGASVDVDKVGDRFSGSAFAIRQVAAGETDRLGVGGELRYFDSERNVYSMIDYDPLFKAVNIGMVQGTWQFPTLTTINALFDYRRTPTLQLTNALIAYPNMSLSTLIQQQGVDAVRDQAKELTPITKQALLGVTQQVSAQWQLGLDVRWSSLSGIPPFQGLPAAPATGNVWTYTGQAIGSGLANLQDILVVNAGVLNGSQLRAQNAGVDYRFVPLPSLTLEPLFGWYHQTDNQGQRLTRLSPGLRASYRLAPRFAIEGQFALERTTTVGNLIDDTIQRYFYYIGWRWDF